jgi:hypothetical protein
MLHAKDCAHLTAKDWAGIAAKIIKLKGDEKLLLAVSDEHAGGVTSCMPEVKQALDGFASQASILLMNGDDYEYESPAAFKEAVALLQKRFPARGADYRQAMLETAEEILHQKVKDDIAALTALITENPDRKIVKVIGNHENFETFRAALTELEKQYPNNFQWVPEVAVIPMPGGEKGNRDRLLATHGDLQMDDLWFVEDGGTDIERKCLTHSEMAQKAVSIATNIWAASAQKQEKGQKFVNWWRKPNVTAKTLYAELLYHAQEGDFYKAVKKNEIDIDALDFTASKLKKRRKKFEELKEELAQRTDLLPPQFEAENLVYTRAIERTTQQLENIEERLGDLARKSQVMLPHGLKSDRKVNYYKKLGEHEPKILTSKALEKITHVNYGHTHVSAEEVKISGIQGKEVIVSNNASITGAIMQRPLDAKGRPDTWTRNTPQETDLGNLGMLLYRVKDGKITEIKTVGRLLAENIQLVKKLINDIPKPTHLAINNAITPEAIMQRRAGGDYSGRQ